MPQTPTSESAPELCTMATDKYSKLIPVAPSLIWKLIPLGAQFGIDFSGTVTMTRVPLRCVSLRVVACVVACVVVCVWHNKGIRIHMWMFLFACSCLSLTEIKRVHKCVRVRQCGR